MDSLTDMSRFVYNGYGPNQTPIQIVPTEMTRNGQTETVYVVGLSGTDLGADGAGQSLGVYQNAVTALGFKHEANPYLNAVAGAMEDAIPEGSKVFFAGHSLGGSVAQLAATFNRITDRYDIEGGVGIGSPLVGPLQREGDWIRVGTDGDPIPLLSPRFAAASAIGTNWEGGDAYATRNPLDALQADGAHRAGYLDDAVWQGYDPTGSKGSVTIEYDTEDVRRYSAPNLFHSIGVTSSASPVDEMDAQSTIATGLLARLGEAESPGERDAIVAQVPSPEGMSSPRDASPDASRDAVAQDASAREPVPSQMDLVQ